MPVPVLKYFHNVMLSLLHRTEWKFWKFLILSPVKMLLSLSLSIATTTTSSIFVRPRKAR